jgi:hypothetical protein
MKLANVRLACAQRCRWAQAAAAKGMAAEAQERLRKFWEQQRLRQLTEALVTRFLPLGVRASLPAQSVHGSEALGALL